MFQAICLHMLSQLYYRHDGSHYILHYVSTDQLQNYGDTQTLRADDSRLQFRGAGLALSSQFNAGGMSPNQGNDEHAPTAQNKQSAEPMALSVRMQRIIS
mgnify:CR=1 FL=1